MAAILNTAILNLAIFDSSILVCPLKLTHTCQDGFPPFPQKNFTHSFWLNLMMAAILNSTMLHSDTAILNSDTLLSSLRFTQKHSHSILTLTQTNSIWLKVIHSHLTWWWQPSCILPSWILISWILPFCSKLWLQLIQSDSKSFILTQLDDGSHLGFSHFAQQKLHSLILTQLDDGSHIEFCHIGSSHSAQKNFTHFFWLNLMIAAILKSANLNSTILDSIILVFPLKLTHTCQD